MKHSQWNLAVLAFVSAIVLTSQVALAQGVYPQNAGANLQYPRSRGLDSNGRISDVDGRSIDQYGIYTDDYGEFSTPYGVPGHFHGNGYTTGGYYPGSYSGLGYSNSLGYTVGLSGYSGGFNPYPSRTSSGAIAATSINPPRSIIVGGVYPSRTVMNNATRGGVMESIQGGKGYIYTAGSSYQTVISSGPSIFPSISVVQPSQPPVIIEARKMTSPQSLDNGTANRARMGSKAEIKLMYPKSATAPLSYQLNGTAYSINPGYIQTFADDRIWSIEFFRAGNRSQIMNYELTAGTYLFDADENGWDLKQAPVAVPSSGVSPPPPPVPAPIPAPDF